MSDTAFYCDKLAIFGVGLIGGSFALGLRRAGAVKHVVGVGRSRANLEQALSLGVIDEIAVDARTALKNADLVLLAVPVAQNTRVMNDIAPHLPAHCVVTDGGSTKRDVVASAQSAFARGIGQFVPAHPIAGAEHSGVTAARAELYQNKLVVLTPLPETTPEALLKVRSAWRLCGARIQEMTPQRHDEVFAAVSHLPHALAFSLVSMMAARPDGEELFSFAGAGFRDFTRIASSSPEMWRDICLANGDAILRGLDDYQAALQTLRGMIAANQGEALAALFEHARTARDHWLKSKS